MPFNSELEAVCSYAQSQNIKIDKEEFKFQVETHPNFPSLLAFTDALTFFNIPNIALKLPFEEIEKLDNSFVALLKNENQSQTFYYVTRDGNFYSFKKNNKTKKLTKEEIKKQWLEIVLLAEDSENHQEKNNSKTNTTTFTVVFMGAFFV